MNTIPSFELNDENRIPQLGFGVCPDPAAGDRGIGAHRARSRVSALRHRAHVPQ